VNRARQIRKRWLDGGSTTAEWRQELLSLNPAEFMHKRELKRLQGLPDEFTVYRGFQPPSPSDGISWTLDRNVAFYFSMRNYSRPLGEVVQRVVKKSDVFALLADGCKYFVEILIVLQKRVPSEPENPRCVVTETHPSTTSGSSPV
jgi:hypothetical protein